MLPVVFPTMQHGQTRPLEKERSFRAGFDTEAPPILLVDEPLLGLCHRQKCASLGRHDPNLFGLGNSYGKPILMIFEPSFADPDCSHRRYQPRPRPLGSVPDAPVPSSLSPVHTWSENRRSPEYRLLRSERDLGASGEEDRVLDRAACGPGG